MKKYSGLNKITLFDLCVAAILIIVGIVVLYPLIFVLVSSISDPVEVNAGNVILLPKGLQFDGYKEVFKSKWIMIGYRNSLFYTIVGTVLNLICTLMAGYVLSRRDLFGRKIWNWYIAIPMWFSGGLIPTYLTVFKIGLVNNPLVLLLIGLVSSYNIIICRTFMSSLPYELQEAAKIDGCSDFQVFRRIILPLSAPVTAVLSLYYAVSHWNSYFTPMIYINNKEWQTLQVFLREILLLNESLSDEAVDIETLIEQQRLAQTMKYSLIVVASLPLLIIYPMLQKFFAKGVMVGAVKG